MAEKLDKELYEDEIDLYELILVLKKRIKYVVGVFVLGIVIATVVSLLMPNIYQARATLWVDSTLTRLLLENPNLINSQNKLSFIIPIEVLEATNVNKLAISVLNGFYFKKGVLEKIKELYKNTEDIEGLEKALNSGKGEKLFKSELDKKTQSIIITSEQKNRKLAEDILKIVIEELEKELERLSKNYHSVFSLNSSGKKEVAKAFILNVIEKPNSLEEPVKPKRGLIIAVSGISSLFFGIFLAFLVEWWNNLKLRNG